MGISTSLVLIAVGAILKWAVTASSSGINLGTVGVVLMIVGAVGLVLSLIFWSSWGGFGSRTGSRTVVREDTTTLGPRCVGRVASVVRRRPRDPAYVK
jgi:hypothetical protein